MPSINQEKVEDVKGKAIFYYSPSLKGLSTEEQANLLKNVKRNTTCLLILPNKTIFKGRASCSFKDVFRKKTGRDISLGRAVSNLKRARAETELTDFETSLIEKI